ncbi:MAG: hypothetical protein RL329_1755 [Bacteroidota bacterium]
MNTLFLILSMRYNIDYQCFTDSLSPLQIAQTFQDTGSYYYDRNPRRSFRALDSAAFYYQKAHVRDKQALCLQNAAFVLQEQFNQIDSSLTYINQALAIWRDLNSTMDEANLLKYRGLLKTFLTQYASADADILEAERLFYLKKNPYGVAVCWYDRAVLFQKQQLLDSAAYFALRAKQFWQTKQDTGRILGINNLLMQVRPNPDWVQEGEFLLQSEAVYWKNRCDFYQNCIDLYNKALNLEKVALYRKRLSDYLQVCKANGLN